MSSHFLFQLVYMSLAVRPFPLEELEELLRGARKHNGELGVTGVLLYEGNTFIQALEGDESVVQALYDKIALDPRHRAVNVLWQGNVATRSFAEWTMGFVDGGDSRVREAEGYRDFFANGGARSVAWVNPSRATQLLRDFRQLPWREAMKAARTPRA